jgi:hypothetical protein
MTKANLNEILDEVTLPEYTGTTDGDRALYLRANSHALATGAVMDAARPGHDHLAELKSAQILFDNASQIAEHLSDAAYPVPDNAAE